MPGVADLRTLAQKKAHFYTNIRCRQVIAITVILIALLPSCTSLPEGTKRFLVPGTGQLTVYLNGPQKSVRRIAFVLDRIEAQNADGEWFPVDSRPIRVDSHAVLGTQQRLTETVLPKGQYGALKLVLAEATLIDDGEKASLLVSNKEVTVDSPFEIFGEENTTLFLGWDVDSSVPKEHLFAPVFTAELEGRQLPRLQIYVTNEGSDNVSIINRAVDKVVSVVAVGREPRGIVVSPDPEGRFVYVANSGSDNVSVIDTSTNRVVHTVNLSFGDEPRDLALDGRGRNLFVVNHRTDSVSVIDAFSFQVRARIAVGKGPVAIGIDERRGKAYVVNSLSNDVTVLDVSSQRVLTTVRVESQPFDVAVDSRNHRVFVVNRGASNLTVFDSASDRVIATVNVGIDAAGVAVDPGRDRIFVSKGLSGRVLFVRPSLNSITNTVKTEGVPGRLTLDPEKRKLFVVNHGSNTLTIIDKFTARKETTIPVGSMPFDVVSTE